MKKVYKMQDLDCAHCAAKMETAIGKIPGVEKATMSFMTQKLTIEVADGADLDAIMQQAQAACKKVEPDCSILL